MKTALLTLLFLATASQVLAAPLRAYRNQPPTVTCATVRAYVSLLGLAQAQSDGASQRDDSCARTESNAVPRGRGLTYAELIGCGMRAFQDYKARTFSSCGSIVVSGTTIASAQ